MRRVLLVEDDAPVRDALVQSLMLAECDPVPAGSFVVAKDHISPQFEGVIVSDIRMPGRDGFHLLHHAQQVDPDLPVILLTGEGDIPMAVRAMGEGAFGFLEKPCSPNELMKVVERALKTRELVLENRTLKRQLHVGDPAARLIFGISDKAEQLRDQVRTIARSNSDAFITGAPGSGISKIAEVIHLCSDGARTAFVKRSGAGMEPEALEAALREAQGGTLFIDTIDALPAQTQFLLFDRLEQSNAPRLIGGSDSSDVLQSKLTADLFHRLDIGRAHISALSERPEDIPVLFKQYVAQAAEQYGVPVPEIGPELLASLHAQSWPGNARALVSAAMRFVLGVSQPDAEQDKLSLSEQMAQVERSLLVSALSKHEGRASEAAKALKLPRKTFYDKLARYGIKAEEYRKG